jgi:hypothetical protein
MSGLFEVKLSLEGISSLIYMNYPSAALPSCPFRIKKTSKQIGYGTDHDVAEVPGPINRGYLHAAVSGSAVGRCWCRPSRTQASSFMFAPLLSRKTSLAIDCQSILWVLRPLWQA